MNIKQTITRNLINIPGWHTNRKIVVIESDDWGSIRMPSKEAYNFLLKKGIKVDKCHYCKYDSLASDTDLSLLYEVLTSFKDINNNHPIITANSVLVNPDFYKIKQANYQEYYYQTFTETLKNYPHHTHSFELWQEGINKNIFYPQYHGREHLNVNRWLNSLRNNSKETILAFEQNIFGLSTNIVHENRKSFMAAYDLDEINDIKKQSAIIQEGLFLFKEILGYSPVSFIAPNYTWYSDLEKILFDNKILSIQGLHLHRDASIGEKKQLKFRYIGQKNKSGLSSLVRNVFFEPSENTNKDWKDTCLSEIERAFRWKKPAIICSHRVNFIGEIEEKNRNNNLQLLSKLLSSILAKWPDVEFLSSADLTKLFEDNGRQ
ncbi:hypothetical protein AGMMS50239_25410 [Bacteroidia bacterium]|nr:hypothetical protein AGMMS50239_25170 [Bacteroidia bacterium]GHT65498.1 hypothetical protein AGMMS50239_25410 [Bacteroidia bacterium]